MPWNIRPSFCGLVIIYSSLMEHLKQSENIQRQHLQNICKIMKCYIPITFKILHVLNVQRPWRLQNIIGNVLRNIQNMSFVVQLIWILFLWMKSVLHFHILILIQNKLIQKDSHCQCFYRNVNMMLKYSLFMNALWSLDYSQNINTKILYKHYLWNVLFHVF